MKKIISKKDLKSFEKSGYLLVNNVLKNNELQDIRKILKKLEKIQKSSRGVTEPGVKKSLIHSLHKEKGLNKIIERKLVSRVFKTFKTNSISVWNAKSNLKQRWNGSVEYFHQDFIYWRELGFQSSKMLNCMVFIDDHSHLNGGLWIFPDLIKSYINIHLLNINSLHKYFIHPNLLDKLSLKFKPLSITAKKVLVYFFIVNLYMVLHNISSQDRKILLYDVSTTKHFERANKLKIRTFNRDYRKKFEKKILMQRLNAIS